MVSARSLSVTKANQNLSLRLSCAFVAAPSHSNSLDTHKQTKNSFWLPQADSQSESSRTLAIKSRNYIPYIHILSILCIEALVLKSSVVRVYIPSILFLYKYVAATLLANDGAPLNWPKLSNCFCTASPCSPSTFVAYVRRTTSSSSTSSSSSPVTSTGSGTTRI